MQIHIVVCCIIVGLFVAPANAELPFTVSNLEDGERIEVHFDTRGCFHHSSSTLTFRKGRAILEIGDLTGGRAELISLSSKDTFEIDNYLRFADERGSIGGCTTVDTYTLSLWRGNQLLETVKLRDATCSDLSERAERFIAEREGRPMKDKSSEPKRLRPSELFGRVSD